MDAKKKRKIRHLAYKVRELFEQIASDEDYDYKNLAGYCARASAVLSERLTKEKIRHRLVYGIEHVYIECSGYVVDVTATQFLHDKNSYGRTLIRPIKEMYNYNRWWQTSYKFNGIGHLRNWQKEENWPDEQMISEYDFVT